MELQNIGGNLLYLSSSINTNIFVPYPQSQGHQRTDFSLSDIEENFRNKNTWVGGQKGSFPQHLITKMAVGDEISLS